MAGVRTGLGFGTAADQTAQYFQVKLFSGICCQYSLNISRNNFLGIFLDIFLILPQIAQYLKEIFGGHFHFLTTASGKISRYFLGHFILHFISTATDQYDQYFRLN